MDLSLHPIVSKEFKASVSVCLAWFEVEQVELGAVSSNYWRMASASRLMLHFVDFLKRFPSGVYHSAYQMGLSSLLYNLLRIRSSFEGIFQNFLMELESLVALCKYIPSDYESLSVHVLQNIINVVLFPMELTEYS